MYVLNRYYTVVSESTDLHKKARELTRSAAQKQQQLLTMEQQFNFGSFEERHDVLAHGKQEVLTYNNYE